MAEIELTQDYKTDVDDADYTWLSQHKWHVQRCGSKIYAARKSGPRGKCKTIYMHKVLHDAKMVDHRDGDGLNNRRENLRASGKAANMRNTGLSKRNTSGFKGVSFFKRTGKWTACVSIEGIQKRLGYFDTPEAAHLAYRVYLESQLGQNYEAEICPAFFHE